LPGKETLKKGPKIDAQDRGFRYWSSEHDAKIPGPQGGQNGLARGKDKSKNRLRAASTRQNQGEGKKRNRSGKKSKNVKVNTGAESYQRQPGGSRGRPGGHDQSSHQTRGAGKIANVEKE